MREYVVLQTEFWINPQYASFSLKARLIAAYLLTCPHLEGEQNLRTAEDYICSAFGFDRRSVRRAIQELVEAKFLSPNYIRGWKLVNFFKNEGKMNSEKPGKKRFTKNVIYNCKDF